jgi:oxygen-independent coproporphyrinogen-3 oxidase
MRLTFSLLDKIRKDHRLLTLINAKELLVSKKTANIDEISQLWRTYLKKRQSFPITLYVHTPFCLDKICNFCVYSSIVLTDKRDLDRYLDDLERQAGLFQHLLKGKKLEALYLGGGTPSIYNLEQLKRLYQIIFDNFAFYKNSSFSLEFSLETINKDKLDLSLSRGFGEFSFGIQSFDPEVLRLSGNSPHDISKLKSLITHIHKHQGTVVSFDLIWGLPGDTLAKLENSIRKGISFKPDHLVIYSFYYSDQVQARNSKNQEYSSYKRPYEEQAVKKLLTDLSQEFPGIKFDLSSMCSASLILKEPRRDSQRNYFTQPVSMLRNSNLGLGINSISFIQNDYAYTCKSFDSYFLTYCSKKAYLKVFYVLDSLLKLNKTIGIAGYKKQFSSDFKEDFRPQLDFLLKCKKLKRKGGQYIPLHKNEDELIDIGLAFLPMEKLEKLSGIAKIN